MEKTQKKMTIEEALRPLTDEQIDSLSRKDLKVLLKTEQRLRVQYEEIHRRLDYLEALNKELDEQCMWIEDKFVRIKSKLFDPRSEKSPKKKNPKGKGERKPRSDTSKKPSERYPNVPIIEKDITLESPPVCPCCHERMEDSEMVETSEYLTVIPKKYLIIRQHRHKYRCPGCHGALETAPALPRVIPGSSYSDEMIVDVTLSKFLDLIPTERYCAMAKRQGFHGLPANSLIQTQIKLAEFLYEVYLLIRQEVLKALILQGDETPHRMLEGDEKSRWYLWCFTCTTATFFEYHDTRAGEVASAVLLESDAVAFMSDRYSGYGKAIRIANEQRELEGREKIEDANCNAHSRRGFNEAIKVGYEEGEFFIKTYRKIYQREKDLTGDYSQDLQIRASMRGWFESMKEEAETLLQKTSSHSSLYKGCDYLVKYYDGLTKCLGDPRIPLDNNQSERELRSPVIGRKTWYGTHSKDGAMSAAVHFTIVSSCKQNNVNPREYYGEIIRTIHHKKPLFTPSQFKERKKEKESIVQPQKISQADQNTS